MSHFVSVKTIQMKHKKVNTTEGVCGHNSITAGTDKWKQAPRKMGTEQERKSYQLPSGDTYIGHDIDKGNHLFLCWTCAARGTPVSIAAYHWCCDDNINPALPFTNLMIQTRISGIVMMLRI